MAVRHFGLLMTLSAGLLLAGCGASGDAPVSGPVTVVTAAAASVAPVPVTVTSAPPSSSPTQSVAAVSTAAASSPASTASTSSPTSAPSAAAVSTAAVASPASTALAPLDLSDMRLWNYAGKWHASEWANAFSPIPWKFDHISQPAGGDTFFKLDAAGAPELQAMGGTPVYTRGLWETEVTLPQLQNGLIVAPLWLWDSGSSDEVDFEYAGRNGLDVTLHASVNGVMQQNTVRLFAGRDMSGERHRFGIKVDEAAGYVEMYFDGQLVQRWNRASTNVFVSHSLKPIISMWAADPTNAGFVYWAGKWAGLTANQTLTMTVHGYGYTALP